MPDTPDNKSRFGLDAARLDAHIHALSPKRMVRPTPDRKDGFLGCSMRAVVPSVADRIVGDNGAAARRSLGSEWRCGPSPRPLLLLGHAGLDERQASL